ncbi:MAG: AIPR family protein [Methylobacterium sp.]|nr:AIPR family protein [Methylobacterium sp.]
MNNLKDQISSSIIELAKRAQITNERAFAAWIAINFFDLDEDDALEAAAADGGNDQGIDLVFLDESSKQLTVIQAHYPTNQVKETPKSKFDALVSCRSYIESPDDLVPLGRKELADQIKEIKTNSENGVYLYLCSFGMRNDTITRSVATHNKVSNGNGCTYAYVAQEDILEKFQSIIDSEQGIQEDTITFAGNYFVDGGDYGRAWIGSVDASELRRLHRKYDVRLFSGNIRLFLGARRGGINEQIIKTATEAPGTFWALNNGITILADTVEEGDRSNTITARRFSIVNGCQTTSSLVQSEAGKEVKVLARVIAAKASLRNDIVRYNNSQNAIKIWTVRAVDAVQERIRKELSGIGISYAPKQSGARKNKGPDVIELDRIAQYLASKNTDLLIAAINNKAELFDEPYQTIFHREITSKEVYLAWLCGQLCDVEREELLHALGENDSNSGLLIVSSRFWILNCVFRLIENFSDFGSPVITIEKMNTPEFKSALQKYVKKAGELYFDTAVDTYDSDEYGSFKATLRSNSFLKRMESKLSLKIKKIDKKSLPDLKNVCKAAKT